MDSKYRISEAFSDDVGTGQLGPRQFEALQGLFLDPPAINSQDTKNRLPDVNFSEFGILC